MCVVTVLNGSKYVKKQEKKKQNKKNLYILSRFLNKIEKNTVSMKKKSKFLYKKIKSIATINMSNLSL